MRPAALPHRMYSSRTLLQRHRRMGFLQAAQSRLRLSWREKQGVQALPPMGMQCRALLPECRCQAEEKEEGQERPGS